MRNIIKHILLPSLCLWCGMAYGQGTGVLYTSPLFGQSNMVRYLPTIGKHIVYTLVAGSENHFTLTDLSTSVDVKVADGLDVRDFEVIGETVFFCGKNSIGSGSGFLGWFNINDLFYMGIPASIDQTLGIVGLQSLDNIVLYHDPSGTIHIAGYGQSALIPPNYNMYRAFEAVGDPATTMQYRALALWSSGVFGHVSDVVVTDDFVVYLQPVRSGCDHEGVGITLQPFPKYNMFSSAPYYYHYFQFASMSALYSNEYVLPINDDPCKDVEPLMVHPESNKVAVCSYRLDLDDVNGIGPDPVVPCNHSFPPITAYLAHRVFDLSPLLSSMNNAILMTSNAAAKLPDINAKSIDGFEYEPQTHRYVVLHRHGTLLGMDEHAVTTIDFLLGIAPSFVDSYYQTAYNTISHWMPTDLCMANTLYYTVTGYDMNTNAQMFWHDYIVPTIGACDTKVSYPVTPLENIPEKHFENTEVPSAWHYLQFVMQESVDPHNAGCNIICN